MVTATEENYLKAIYNIQEKDGGMASTNGIAKLVNTAPASVTDMLNRLSGKGLLIYEKYKGVQLSAEGKKIATELIRKHRIWKTFLVDKLHFNWDQVQKIANQLEHVQSEPLINKLDAFLDFPKFDPHGEPIPSNEGKITIRKQIKLADLKIDESGTLIGVKQNDEDFLSYLNHLQIKLGTKFKVLEYIEYENSFLLLVDMTKKLTLSSGVCCNLILRKNNI
jgi:DtxR family Mn-dependent transcriptional regulator